MAKFKISGVWITSGVITHYAIHYPVGTGFNRAIKTSKSNAIALLNVPGNEAMTWLWDYNRADWKDGAKVEVINGQYLRSYHDGTVRDNLSHLINYDWL